MNGIFGEYFLGTLKGTSLASTHKNMSFFTISNENTFFKTKDSRLGPIVAPVEALE